MLQPKTKIKAMMFELSIGHLLPASPVFLVQVVERLGGALHGGSHPDDGQMAAHQAHALSTGIDEPES